MDNTNFVDAIEVDGKIYTEDTIRKLQQDYDEYDRKIDKAIACVHEMRRERGVAVNE